MKRSSKVFIKAMIIVAYEAHRIGEPDFYEAYRIGEPADIHMSDHCSHTTPTACLSFI